jgi:hypothetical protein
MMNDYMPAAGPACVGNASDLFEGTLTLAKTARNHLFTASGKADDETHSEIMKSMLDYLDTTLDSVDNNDDDVVSMFPKQIFMGMSQIFQSILNDCSTNNLKMLDAFLPKHFAEKAQSSFVVMKRGRASSSSSNDSSDNDEYMEVNPDVAVKRPKKRATLSAVGEALSEIELSNKFSPLNSEENLINMDTNENLNVPQYAEIVNSNINYNTNSNHNTNPPTNDATNAQAKTAKIRKLDPFWLQREQQDWRSIVKELNNECKQALPLENSGKFIKIFPNDDDQFRLIQRNLIKKNVKFFSHNPRSERPLKVVIKRIAPDIPIDEIKDELTKLGFSYARVGQLKDFKTKQPLDVFIISLLKTENVRDIFKIEKFLYFNNVKVEAYTFKGTKQCYRCQNFYHSSENCTMDPHSVYVAVRDTSPETARDQKLTKENVLIVAKATALTIKVVKTTLITRIIGKKQILSKTSN